MYDAGKIFCAGGAPSYQESDTTNLAYHIELDEPAAIPVVTKFAAMNYNVRSPTQSLYLMTKSSSQAANPMPCP